MTKRKKSPEINPRNPPPSFYARREDYQVSTKMSRPEVETDLIQRAKRILGVKTASEAVRLALENVDTLAIFDYHLETIEQKVDNRAAELDEKINLILKIIQHTP